MTFIPLPIHKDPGLEIGLEGLVFESIAGTGREKTA
jgi:hypothetical protein